MGTWGRWVEYVPDTSVRARELLYHIVRVAAVVFDDDAVEL